MKSVVEVDGVQVGWFEAGTYYRGRTYDLGHPSADVHETGEIVANDFGNQSLGWVEPSGEVRAGAQYSDARAGSVTLSGEICDPSGRVVGVASGPNAQEAGAAWLLLEQRAASGDARRDIAAAASAASAWITTHEPTTDAEPPRGTADVEEVVGSTGAVTPGASTRPFDPQTDWSPGEAWPTLYTPVRQSGSSLPRFMRRRIGRVAVGDHVDVDRFGPLGHHVVLEISEETGRGGGTRLYPAFLCESLQDGRRDWFGYGSLTLV